MSRTTNRGSRDYLATSNTRGRGMRFRGTAEVRALAMRQSCQIFYIGSLGNGVDNDIL